MAGLGDDFGAVESWMYTCRRLGLQRCRQWVLAKWRRPLRSGLAG